MKKELIRVGKTRDEYEVACAKLDDKIKEVCDFEAGLTWCASDGHLVINVDTASVALLECLDGRTKKNKLSEDDHLTYCI